MKHGDTRTDLVEELRKKPQSDTRDKLINMARRGEFHDYKSERFAMPKVELVKRLKAAGYIDLVQRVVDGAYDEMADADDDAQMKRDWLANGGTEESWAATFGGKPPPEALTSTIHATCPFCNGEFFDGRDPDTMEAVSLIHSMPMCEQFQHLEPVDYLKAVNDFNASVALDPLSKKEPGQA